jgi:hypothetical protein
MGAGVDNFFREWSAGRPVEAFALVSPDFTFWPPIHADPLTELVIVHAACQQFYASFNGTFRFLDRAQGEQFHYLPWRGEINGVPADGMDIFREDGEGRLLEMRVLMRPPEAGQALTDHMVRAFGQYDDRHETFGVDDE